MWPTTLPSFSTATACRSNSSSIAQQSFVDLSTQIRGRGEGLTARRKRKSSLLPPPPLFPGGKSQKGGCNSGAVWYIHVLQCTYVYIHIQYRNTYCKLLKLVCTSTCTCSCNDWFSAWISCMHVRMDTNPPHNNCNYYCRGS